MTVYPKNSVRILTSQGSVDPNTYVVDFVKGAQVGLTCQSTNIQTKVHSSRVHEILGEETMTETTETTTTDSETTTKPKRKRTPKAPPVAVDFDALATEGYEPWVKGGLSLGSDEKVKNIAVAAACLIDPLGRLDDIGLENSQAKTRSGYEVFNLYNGTRGKKGKRGKFFPFTEKLTIEKKRKALEKAGYACLGTQISLDEVLEEAEAIEVEVATTVPVAPPLAPLPAIAVAAEVEADVIEAQPEEELAGAEV